jgi:hypothetical protein
MLGNQVESTDVQRYRPNAMLMASEADCTRLCQSLDEDLRPNYEGWDDNGGGPDGDSWLIWPCDDALIACADRAVVPYQVVGGYELPYPSELSEAFRRGLLALDGRWSGVSANGWAFVVSESDAVKFMRAASLSEQEE